MKNKLAWLFGGLFVIYLAYGLFASYLGIKDGISFGWLDAVKIFTPLVILASLFAYSINRKIESLDIIQRRLIALYIIGVVFFFWVISPIEDFLILNISAGQVAIDVFFYLWEAMLFGGIGTAIFIKWFRPVRDFLKSYESDVKKINKETIIKISDLVSRFPSKTALTAGILSTIGYFIGAAGFYFLHPQTPLSLVVNDILIGIAIGQMIFAAIYFASRYIVKDVASILYIFGDVTSPKKVLGIGTKIFYFGLGPGIFFTATMLALLINLTGGRIDALSCFVGMGINFVLGLSLMIVTGYIFLSDGLSSLLEVKHGMELMESGNWSYRMNMKTGDEIEDLAHAFNKMANHLEKNCK